MSELKSLCDNSLLRPRMIGVCDHAAMPADRLGVSAATSCNLLSADAGLARVASNSAPWPPV